MIILCSISDKNYFECIEEENYSLDEVMVSEVFMYSFPVAKYVQNRVIICLLC